VGEEGVSGSSKLGIIQKWNISEKIRKNQEKMK
jgi:hypothetical protein